VRIKICGVTTVSDAIAAVDAGADAIGLNFHPSSPRFIDEPTARAIVRALPPFITPVAVMVRPSANQLLHLIDGVGITWFQLHAAQLESILPRISPERWKGIPAHGMSNGHDVTCVFDQVVALRKHAEAAALRAVLLDARSPVDGVHGGTGLTAPWPEIGKMAWPLPVILAGGLTAANVADAIRAVRPHGVDVASGVESAPGKKDPVKMQAFVRAVKAASGHVGVP